MLVNEGDKVMNEREHHLLTTPTVLVVDDDIFSRRVLIAHLEDQNYQIIEAENGVEALRVFESQLPDIVLMDAIMPELDGYSACREIKKRPDAKNIPVLMLTMMDDEDSIVRGFEAGASDYIPKPYNWSLLSYRMRNLIDHKQVEEERENIELQLRQAQKMEAIGRFTGGIAHDFNNILAGMMGFTELAQEKYADDKHSNLTRYLSNIHQNGQRAQQLIEKMLAFCRKTGGEGELISFPGEIRNVIEMLRPILPTSIELNTHIEENTLAFKVSPVLLHQVIMNLCVNARDAIEGTGSIDIYVRNINDINVQCISCYKKVTGNFVELRISDTGKGIGITEQSKIFDPYFTTKEIGDGAGMGLSVVHGVMHECEGHILLESEPGKGSTFVLLFPMINVKDIEVEVDDSINIIEPLMCFGKHVMVVDDEENIAEYLCELLISKGCQVTVKTNSEEALASFRESPHEFDLIITDQTMPKLTGVELVQEMLEMRPELPIILCTGYSEKVDEKKAKELGIKGFLFKPIDLNKLFSCMNELLVH